MVNFVRKYRVYFAVGLALLAAFAFFSLNLREKERATPFERGALKVFSPLQGLLSRGSGFVASLWGDYLYLVGVREENKKLREAVKVLNTRILEGREAALSNERLKNLLALKTSLRSPSVAASVIGEESAPWFKTIVIDRGASDGLQDGMPVVAVAGVVGQVVKVAANSARVLLLTDHAGAVAAVVQRSRARGVVKGKGGELCMLEFTVKEEDVKVGDPVLTSGIGGVFPRGLPVGEVTMVRKGEYGIFQTIEVRPAVNLSRLEEVLVLLQQSHD